MAGKKRPGKDVEVEIPAPKFAMLEVVIDGDTPLIAQQMSQKNTLFSRNGWDPDREYSKRKNVDGKMPDTTLQDHVFIYLIEKIILCWYRFYGIPNVFCPELDRECIRFRMIGAKGQGIRTILILIFKINITAVIDYHRPVGKKEQV